MGRAHLRAGRAGALRPRRGASAARGAGRGRGAGGGCSRSRPGDAPLTLPDPDAPPPAGLRPLGLVVLAEELRPDTRETIAFLLERGHGHPGDLGRRPRHGRRDRRRRGHPACAASRWTAASCPRATPSCCELVRTTTVVGRISPDGKRRYVEALARRRRARRDGGRRGQRRARPEGGPPRDRPGQRLADGPRRSPTSCW